MRRIPWEWHEVIRLILAVSGIIGCVWALAVLGCKCTSERTIIEEHSRSECGRDVVYSVDRFGAYNTPLCFKVQCWSLQERTMYERIGCVEAEP